MLSLDIYVNETTRHADVILPGSPRWRTCHDPPLPSSATATTRARARCSSPPPSRRRVADPAEAWPPSLEGRARDVDAWRAGRRSCWLPTLRASAGLRSTPPDAPATTARQAPTACWTWRCAPAPRRPVRPQARTASPRQGPGPVHAEPTAASTWDPLQPRIPELLRTESGKMNWRPVAHRRGPGPAHGPRACAAVHADRPARRARIEQQLDAQPPVLARGRRALHAADPPGRCGATPAWRLRPAGSVRHRDVTARVERTNAMARGVVSLPHGWEATTSPAASSPSPSGPAPTSTRCWAPRRETRCRAMRCCRCRGRAEGGPSRWAVTAKPVATCRPLAPGGRLQTGALQRNQRRLVALLGNAHGHPSDNSEWTLLADLTQPAAMAA